MGSRRERFSGTLNSWNDERGFGFVSPLGSARRVFVHISAFPAGSARPLVGDALAFGIDTSDGKDRAISVTSSRPVRFVPRETRGADAFRSRRPKAASALPSYLLLGAFAALYIGVWSEWGVPIWLTVAYLALSLITVVVYATDKRAARAGTHRVSENTLHLLALAGGWPGAIVAQQSLRHKTAKPSFRGFFWVTATLNILGFIAFATPAVALLIGVAAA